MVAPSLSFLFFFFIIYFILFYFISDDFFFPSFQIPFHNIYIHFDGNTFANAKVREIDLQAASYGYINLDLLENLYRVTSHQIIFCGLVVVR